MEHRLGGLDRGLGHGREERLRPADFGGRGVHEVDCAVRDVLGERMSAEHHPLPAAIIEIPF